jgi:hypothetical protein
MATRVTVSLWKKGGLMGADAPLGHYYLDISKVSIRTT